MTTTVFSEIDEALDGVVEKFCRAAVLLPVGDRLALYEGCAEMFAADMKERGAPGWIERAAFEEFTARASVRLRALDQAAGAA